MATTYNTLADRCESKLGDYSNTDTGWVQFVKDHREMLLQNSTVLEMSLEVAHRYRFSLALLLYDRSMDQSTMWIIMWLNQISAEHEFKQLQRLLIPTNEYLATLKAQYDSNKQAAESV